MRVGLPLRILLWFLANSAAGASIGFAIAAFQEGTLDRQVIWVSILFGNVVGFTAIISAVYLFPRFVALPTVVQLVLQTGTLLGGSVLGTAVVIQLYPLFLLHEYRTALRIFVVNGVVATIVGTLLFSYEAMRARLRESLRVLEEVRLKESELRTQAARAQLAALQARIKPHFFFNTLNTISSLVADDPDRAEETIALLADLFRYTLKTTGARLVPFRDEVAFVEKYLTIERARFGERLRTGFDIASGCGDAMVPGLILQPIVENAVAHGIAPRAAGGSVEVRARMRDEALEVEVDRRRSGPGPRGEALPGWARPGERARPDHDALRPPGRARRRGPRGRRHEGDPADAAAAPVDGRDGLRCRGVGGRVRDRRAS